MGGLLHNSQKVWWEYLFGYWPPPPPPTHTLSLSFLFLFPPLFVFSLSLCSLPPSVLVFLEASRRLLFSSSSSRSSAWSTTFSRSCIVLALLVSPASSSCTWAAEILSTFSPASSPYLSFFPSLVVDRVLSWPSSTVISMWQASRINSKTIRPVCNHYYCKRWAVSSSSSAQRTRCRTKNSSSSSSSSSRGMVIGRKAADQTLEPLLLDIGV